MEKLIRSDLRLPQGYKFTDPDTGYQYNQEYRNFDELEHHVRQHRTHNKLPMIEKFRAVWEAFACANYPGMAGKCQPVQKHLSRNFEQYWQGGKAFVKAVLFGSGAFVTPEQAEARAQKCIQCNQNVVDIGHTHGKYYSDAAIRTQVGARKVKNHKELHSCAICSCILKSKVHFSDKIVAESLTDKEIGQLTRFPRDKKTAKPIKCWQLESVDTLIEEQKNGSDGN